ncbi:IS66 family insertion sequence element accessory protein TnpB, partial [Novosphingobium lindaniclasticum]|uniref:IS66 family insertion sequence element accessory protein TnpB n=1 Tax=Novosphingobium lindaniclasticum TaxID=1329895 RepID=UPI0038992AFA
DERPDFALWKRHRGHLPGTAHPLRGGGVIGPGTGVRVYLACGVTDMRKGISGLGQLAQTVLRQKPTSGAVFAFRGRRGDRVKLLYWDGQGFCLYYKVLQRGRFPWPSAADGTARLTSAQLAMLWEGIDWRRPNWGAPPAHVG